VLHEVKQKQITQIEAARRVIHGLRAFCCGQASTQDRITLDMGLQQATNAAKSCPQELSWTQLPIKRGYRKLAFACPNPKVKETLLLTSPRCRAILGSPDILVDIGVPAEKEVIQ